MEEKSAVTIKTEIKEEILEDPLTVTDQLGIHEEHNYNNNMLDDHYFYSQLHHSINIKEESDYLETENSCSSEIVSDTTTNYCDSSPQIKVEKDKVMRTENFANSATLLTEQNQFSNIIKSESPTKFSNQQQIFKKEDLDYELAELHHSINIKEEVEFMEAENAVREEYNSDVVRSFLDSEHNSILNNEHSRNNIQGNHFCIM